MSQFQQFKTQEFAKWYIISVLSRKRFYWDINVIIFSVINAIILPIQFAFLSHTDTENVVIEVLDKITITVFVFDMIFNTITSYSSCKEDLKFICCSIR